MTLLEEISALSREFGTEEYVVGGGGNTSAKDAETLWIKPSGTTLPGMNPSAFVPMDRMAMQRLYAGAAPTEPAAPTAMPGSS